MQVQPYDLRDLKRATRRKKPGFELAPEIALGQRVGAVASIDNSVVMSGPPVSSGLVHRYKSTKTLTTAATGSSTTTNATDAVSTPSYLVTESPTGVARTITATTSGSLQHGITAAVTSSESNTSATFRVWVRKAPSGLTPDWVYLQAGGGAFRAWFNIATGAVGSTSGTCVPRVVSSFVSPNDGIVWYLLEIGEFLYSSGANGVFMTDADGNVPVDILATSPTLVYDQLSAFTQDKVSTWNDLVGSDNLSQGSLNVKPTWISRSPNFQGESAAKFFNGHSIAGATAANWQFLHDGSGATVAFPWRCTNLSTASDLGLMTTNGFSTTATGVSMTYIPSTGGLKFDVGGAGSNKIHYQSFFNTLGTGGTDIRNVANWVGFSVASADSPDTRWRINGVEIASGNPSGGFTAAVPATGITFGGAVDFFEIPEVLVWNRALTNLEWDAVHYYFRGLFGTYQP